MTEKIRFNKRCAVCAAAFAAISAILLFDVIFEWKPMGVNIPLTVICLYGAIVCAFKGKLDLMREYNFVLLVPIALLSAAFMIFNNNLLLFFGMVLLFVLMALQICLMTGKEFPRTFGGGFIKSVGTQLFARPFMKIGALFMAIFSGNDKKSKKTALGILLGIAICIPLAIGLIALLASGDMIFGRLFDSIEIDGDGVWNIVLGIILFINAFVFAGSALIAGGAEWNVTDRHEKKQKRMSLPPVFIITSVFAAILLIFGVVQFLYLAKIMFMPAGISYSEYARSGFFQLLGAAALVFAVLAFVMHFTSYAEGKSKIALNIIYTLLACGVLMLLVSAFMRMSLYEQEYSYTRLRLYTQAFMILLALVTVCVLVKIWVRKVKLFKPIMYIITACMVGLIYFNVDGFIAKEAVKRYENGGDEPDYYYLISLSEDALPSYAKYLTPDILTGEVDDWEGEDWELYYYADDSLYDLRQNLDNAEYDDIRSFNVMRYKTQKASDKYKLKEMLDEAEEQFGYEISETEF